MTIGEISDERKFLLATLTPTSGQQRLALAVAAVLLAAIGITIPFAFMQLQRVDSFIPVLQGIFLVNDLITAVLLFSQFSISRSYALLVLASGYLFASLIVIPFALTFPGAFSPNGLLGAGSQSAPWLYTFWHKGFSLALLAYAFLKDTNYINRMVTISARLAIGGSVAIVTILVCGLTWVAIADEKHLPALFYSETTYTPLVSHASMYTILINSVTLALLWIRRRSVLDQWLMVVILAVMSEMLLGGILVITRFSLGFYAGRVFTLVTSVVVLVALIAEITKLHARFVRSNMMLQRERDNKLMNLAALAASISHEVRQPLMAIAMNGGAALQYLRHERANLGEARSAIDTIINDSRRASQIFDNIGALFRDDSHDQAPVDMNEVVFGILRTLRGDLKEKGVATRIELMTGLPRMIGHRGQLQEVVLNLVQNAIEAMDGTEGGRKILCVRTRQSASDEITLTVEDTGPGIDQKYSANLFDAFVTSKPQGMGLGLAICQTIVERHGGLIAVRSRSGNEGASFQCTLPTKPFAVLAQIA